MPYSVTIIVVIALCACVFAIDRLYRLLRRQSEYIMAKEDNKSYQLSKFTTIDKKIREKQDADRRKREEVNNLYDIALSRGEIDEESYKILHAAETE